jgi:hypothetical protein
MSKVPIRNERKKSASGIKLESTQNRPPEETSSTRKNIIIIARIHNANVSRSKNNENTKKGLAAAYKYSNNSFIEFNGD